MPKGDRALYREIPLGNGLVTLVDAEDHDRLSQWKWHAYKPSKSRKFYATRTAKKNGICAPVLMHREVMGLKAGQVITVDHINSEHTLDNRKQNLRLATQSQQNCNRGKSPKNTSGYKGVSFHKPSGKYRAEIKCDKRQYYLGLRDTAEEAHALYCEAAVRLHGEFARFS